MTDNFNTTEEIKHHEPGPLFEASRRVLLAAIGVVTLAQEEAEDFVNRMVERGEIAEKDGKGLVKEMIEKRNARRQTFENKVNKRINETLDRLNLPSKKDLVELNEKITTLTKIVEELQKTKE
jgi:poly(hydroxyalkanoate) granule-associated protein